MESERRELEEMYQEKRRKELEAVSEIIEEAGLEPEEVVEVLQQYLENREEAASWALPPDYSHCHQYLS